jgi:hypothetical protein
VHGAVGSSFAGLTQNRLSLECAEGSCNCAGWKRPAFPCPGRSVVSRVVAPLKRKTQTVQLHSMLASPKGE